MEKRENIGNYIFITGTVMAFMLNLNFYEWYQSMTNWNYLLAAIVIAAVFLCYVDVKDLGVDLFDKSVAIRDKVIFKDKMLIMCLLTNIIALISVLKSKAFNAAILTIFIVSLIIYLADKVKFSKGQIAFLAVFIAAFFVYWTIDVKGYFKGYSINFGGLVLIAGFVFLISSIEYLKYLTLNTDLCGKTVAGVYAKARDYLIRYPYYFTIVEGVLFVIGYRIIAYYQSRTAALVLIIFAVLLLIPRSLLYKRIVNIIISIASMTWVLILPIAYLWASFKGTLANTEIFYRPIIGVRAGNWKTLYDLIKTHPILGNGSIYIGEGSTFRQGFLDTYNSFLQLSVQYGLIVAILVFAMLTFVLFRLGKNISKNPYAVIGYIGTVVFIFVSASENFIFNPIFIFAFAGMLYVTNSFVGFIPIGEARCKNEGKEPGTEHDSSEAFLVTDIWVVYKKNFDNSFKEKFVPVLCVTCMITVMYLILGPLEIFYSNYVEFDFNTVDFILFFTVISGIISLLISLVLASMPKVISTVYCVIMLSWGIGSYIQYMFLNLTLSDVEGTPKLGPEIGSKYYISIAVFVAAFIVIIATSITFKKVKESIFTYVPLALTLVMCTAIVTVAISLINLKNKPDYGVVFDASDEFVMGSKENTIMLMLDTFGREDLNEELAEHPDAIDALHDFTYYDNWDSVYAPTIPSLTHFLTEYEYNGEARADYEKAAYESDGSKIFFGEIRDKGYHINLYTRDILTDDYMEYIADNVFECEKGINNKEIHKVLLNLSAFRYMPYFLKAPFYVQNPGIYTVAYDVRVPDAFNYSFYSHMNETGMSLSDEYDKRFVMHHMYGLHKSYMNDEYCIQTESDVPTRYQALQGLMLALDEYFSRMKDLGIYDDATIIVMSDHGRCYDHTDYDHFHTDPVFFIKKPGEVRDVMDIDSTEHTHHEIQEIVMESLK